MDLLVVGGSGFLGREIIRQARLAGHSVAATFHTRVPATAEINWTNLDIRHRDDVTALVLAARPSVIINAAYRQSDWATTAEGGMHVALAAALGGARLVHVSSDAVFSGTRPRYDRTHAPDPTTPYGAAKAAAETAIKGITPTAVIARTSLIIGYGEPQHERHVHDQQRDGRPGHRPTSAGPPAARWQDHPGRQGPRRQPAASARHHDGITAAGRGRRASRGGRRQAPRNHRRQRSAGERRCRGGDDVGGCGEPAPTSVTPAG